MKKSISFQFILLVFFIASCSPFKVKVDFDSEASFQKYRSFKMLKHKKKKDDRGFIKNPINAKRLSSAIESTLKSKGFEQIEKCPADMLIAYHIGIQRKVDVTVYGYRSWRYPGPHSREVRRYKEGTLIIDVIDAKEKQLVWRGTAEGALREIEFLEEDIREAVEKIFADFPPQ